MDDDIVQSVWKHTAGYNPGHKLTTCAEYKRVLLPNFYIGINELPATSESVNERYPDVGLTNNIRRFIYDADTVLLRLIA